MQYYIKIFNKDSSELVGFYKETGIGCVTKLPNGMKYFNSVTEALNKSIQMDGGFVRDKDGKYYECYTVVCGNSKREPTRTPYRKPLYTQEGDEESAIDTFIRQNRNRIRR